jgi:DNA-binding transcriptional MerR regulator
MPDSSDLLTPQDVARLSGVSAASVRNWERTGKLLATRTASGMRLFMRADVDRLIEHRRQRRAGNRDEVA